MFAVDNWLMALATILPFIAVGGIFFWTKKRGSISDGRTIIFVVIPSFVSAFIFYKISNWNSPTDFLDNFRISFAASFLEDLLFFSIFGCLLFYLQRQSWFSEKRLEDRINFLFNAKNLTSEERTYLKDAVAKSAADFLSDKTIVELVDFDKLGMLKINVSRRFRIGNYLKEQDAIYHFDAWLEADKMPDGRVAMTVHPISTQSILINGLGKVQKLGDKTFLSNHTEIAAEGVFEVPGRNLRIKPGQAIECFYRFEGWQPTLAVPVNEDHYQISIKKHWDRMTIELVNGLSKVAEICVTGPDGVPTTYELPPGHRAEDRWEAVNVSPDKTIGIRFLSFDDHKVVA